LPVPRLFVEGQRFEPVGSRAFLELEYQALINAHSAYLFPGLTFTPFHCVVRFEGVGNAADFALIDPEYRRWWVLEVELAHHSFERHVLPQVETLANATYGPEQAAWLAERNSSLDEVALTHMMRGAQPQVLVVVNSPRPEWELQLRTWAEMMVVEVFRSDKDRLILRQDGAEVELPSEEIGVCRVDPAFPRMLIVESPAPALALGTKILAIDYEGEVTEWKLIEMADKVWLSPQRGGIFPTGRFLNLVRLPGDRLGFVPLDSRKRR
jgi:hypothetical protein